MLRTPLPQTRAITSWCVCTCCYHTSRIAASNTMSRNNQASTRGAPATTEQVAAVLAQQLSRKLQKRFKHVASDPQAQSIIIKEVATFMRRVRAGDSVNEDSVTDLENRVRSKLSGSTPITMTYSMEKRAQVEGDEWAKMFQYHIHKGHALDRRDAEAARQRQIWLRSQLDAQTRELAARKQAERDAEQAYYQSEQASLRAWEASEEMKRQRQASIMRRLGNERVEQLQDKERRKTKALQSVQASEADLAARIAYMTLTELQQDEEEARTKRTRLKDFLEGNELNKQLRLEAVRQQGLEDAEFQRQWQAQLDKQEAARLALVAKTRKKQDLQAAAAAERPECKRWIDQSIIDRNFRESEAAKDRDEQKRKQRIRDAERNAVAVLARQMREREEAKLNELQRDKEAARAVLDRVSREEEQARESQRRAQEAKERFRMALERQMKDNARRRRVAPMTETERRLNTRLLEEVQDWQLTGKMTI